MPRKGHSEEEIVRALRQAEAGKKGSDICREMGVSQQAFYSWHQIAQRLVLLRRTVAPVNPGGLAERCHLLDPRNQLLIGRVGFVHARQFSFFSIVSGQTARTAAF